MTNLYIEAEEIAREAIAECGRDDQDGIEEYIMQSCDSHRVSIMHGAAIEFCANNNTSAGEEWLEDCGGIAQEGDSFGTIACRVAFATLYVNAMAEMLEILQEEAA